jgi:lysophospholipase L1-like esterase
MFFRIILGTLCFMTPLFPGDNPGPGPAGRSACPVFDARGNMTVVYQSDRDILCFSAKNEPAGPATADGQATSSISLGISAKGGGDGGGGVVWLQLGNGTTDLLFGRLVDGRVVESRVLVRSHAPLFSPDLVFDAQSSPWAAWVRQADHGQEIVVANIGLGRTWVVNRPYVASALSPKLLAGSSGNVWVFWTGRDQERDEIFASEYGPRGWSNPDKLAGAARYPHFCPTAALDRAGFPVVVWSEFEGERYKLFGARRVGESWSPEEQITTGAETDLAPAAATVHGVPVVVWVRSSGRSSAIYARYLEGAAWGPEVEVVPDSAAILRSPRVAVFEDRIGLTWDSEGRINSRIFSLTDLDRASRTSSLVSPAAGLAPIYGSNRDENQYTTFGDSITYAENQGYQPRLEPMLIARFGVAKLWNEGVGGEGTADGLIRIETTIAAHPSKQLLLMEGTNDVIFLDISMDTTAFNLEEMVRRCCRAGLLPVISTILPRNDWRWSVAPYQSRIIELNGRIRRLAATFKVPVVDQYEAFYSYPESAGGWTSLLLDDGVHPNPAGFQFMAETWFQAILDLPFAPVDVRQIAGVNKVLWAGQPGNVIAWRNNSKAPADKILAFRIYRREAEGDSVFLYLASLSSSIPFLRNIGDFKYFDAAIVSSKSYQYTVSVLRSDGVEGACSDIGQVVRY